jgi:hypothetical protein
VNVRSGDVGTTGHDVAPSEEHGAPASKERGIAGMEIADYLRVIRRRFWLVALIPLLATASVNVITLNRPTEYSATATVAAPWLISNAPGDTYAAASGGRQYVADFMAAISVPPVVEAVSGATGVEQNDIREGVTATPIGESTLIEVRYVSTQARDTEPVARALAVETLRFLFRPSAVTAFEPEEDAPPNGSPPDAGDPLQELEILLAQPETVSVTPARIESRGPQVIRGVQLGLGGGLLLGLLVVILLELLPFGRGRRSSSRGGSAYTARSDDDAANTMSVVVR